MKAPTIDWPTRKGWTEQRQGLDGYLFFSLSRFATPAEIEAVIRALQLLHETQAGLAKRRVTEAIKKLHNNAFPYVPEVPEAWELLEPLRRRYHDAVKLHQQVSKPYRDARPVDDQAWAQELQRRAAIEAEFAALWHAQEEAESPVELVAAS